MSDINKHYRIREETGEFASKFYIERKMCEPSFGRTDWKQIEGPLSSLSSAKSMIDSWEFKSKTIYHEYP